MVMLQHGSYYCGYRAFIVIHTEVYLLCLWLLHYGVPADEK